MRTPIALIAATVALSAGVAHAASVEIDDAVARITVIPEARSDIKVEVVRAHPQLPLAIRSLGGKTIIDGDLDRRIRNCSGDGTGASVEVRGVGRVAYADMPHVVIRTPREVDLSADGAVFGEVGRSTSLKFGNAGCGDWTVANVDGAMQISQAGSGDSRTGSAGEAKIRIAGSGNVATAEVRGGADVNIAGSGDVAMVSIGGPLSVSIAGSGDVSVAGGAATEVSVSIAGSGDVDFRGSAQTLKARVMGSGDVRAREVKGEVTRTIMGSGAVTIG